MTLFTLLVVLASCGLPRSGPNKREIYSSSVQRKGDAFIVSVNNRVIKYTSVTPALQFSKSFTRAGKIVPDIIHPGDTLDLSVWENTKETLLGGVGGSSTNIQQIQVDASGDIFIPYAGRIKAAGRSPEQLREIITRKLDAQTPDPQVIVRRVAGDGATVSIMGKVAGQGVYPIKAATRTLTAMLAKAGGVTIEPEVAQIKVTRRGQTGTVWLEDLYSNPKDNIALRPGDRIFVQQDRRTFTALGATGSQNRVAFNTQKMSAIEAIARVGGLNSNLADPKGVFVFRDEPAAIANAVLGRTDLVGPQRFVYVLDLTKPDGMFLARDFMIRNGDTIYVTEAPYVQWSKTLGALNSTIRARASLKYATGL